MIHRIFGISATLSLVLLLSTACSGIGADKILITVQRMKAPATPGERAFIDVPWHELIERLPSAKTKSLLVTDLNFGKDVAATLVDNNGDGTPESLVLDFTFPSNEPIFAFSISASGKPLATIHETAFQTNLKVTFLSPSKSATNKKWSDRIIASTMAFYPEPTQIAIYAPAQWNYEYGYFLNGMYAASAVDKNQAYYNYVKKWADHFIDEHGNLDTIQYRVKDYKLDDILPGRLFLFLYEKTKDEKYRHAADILMDHLKHQPKTSDGGYWHKQIYPYQMWLDGIFMGDVFSAQYARLFNEPAMIDEAIRQIKLISKHTLDAKTGLMYHGWDESKNKTWAHQERGTSPAFWGRAVGWYMMALAECLDYIPDNHPERKDVVKIFQSLSASVLKVQDRKSQLWYQVLDKADQPGNWIETSCSAMFAYAMAKGAHQGVLDKSYLNVAQKVFDALTAHYVYVDGDQRIYLDQTVKVGTLNPKFSKGDFDYYISTERRINDYKGLASLLFLSLELEKQ